MLKRLIVLRVLNLILWIAAGIAALISPNGISTACYVLMWVGCLIANAQLIGGAVLRLLEHEDGWY